MDWAARAREIAASYPWPTKDRVLENAIAALAAEAYRKGKQMGIAEGFKVEVVDVTGDAAMMAEVGQLQARVAALTAALREARQWIEIEGDPLREQVVRYVDGVLDAAAGGAS
jgi:hypothetical protein